MSSAYRNQHYVPQWYQDRFVPRARKDRELLYLDLQAGYWIDSKGSCVPKRPIKRLGFRKCFAANDLYTLKLGQHESRDLEKFFFGGIDNRGRRAVEYFSGFTHPSLDETALDDLLRYMSVQKLRTPKGLEWLFAQTAVRTRNHLLLFMQSLADMHVAMWSECIWLLADASESPTKFIVSDHPVTVYNRDCSPTSWECAGSNDPDIRYHGTHTIFPLSLDRVLILTNLSWVRDPHRPAKGTRPNPDLFRPAVFDVRDIQVLRTLAEPEVISINYIVKRRARRHVGAAEEAWLYPERHLPSFAWRKFDDEFLLMPDPRSVTFRGEMMWSNGDRTYGAIDEYGYRPWQPGFANKQRSRDEWATFHRFIGEFARKFGPDRRGRSFHSLRLDPERDSPETHEVNLRYETEHDRFVTL